MFIRIRIHLYAVNQDRSYIPVKVYSPVLFYSTASEAILELGSGAGTVAVFGTVLNQIDRAEAGTKKAPFGANIHK